MARPASFITITALLLAQLAAAIGVAWVVAQGYLAYECDHSEFRSEHPADCAGGFPYPVL